MAKYPHDSKRPETKKVRRAIESGDIELLKDALTIRQRHFAEEYVVDFNAAAAARRAGYSDNYSDRMGHILLRHKGVAAYIDYLNKSKEAKIVSVTPDVLIQRLVEIMERPGIRTTDELRAVEMLMKHLGMFIDRQEITGKDGGPLEIERRQKIQEEADAFTRQLEILRKRATDAKNDAEKQDVKLV